MQQPSKKDGIPGGNGMLENGSTTVVWCVCKEVVSDFNSLQNIARCCLKKKSAGTQCNAE